MHITNLTKYYRTIFVITLTFLCLSCFYNSPDVVDPAFAFWEEKDRILFQSNDSIYVKILNKEYGDFKLEINGVLESITDHEDSILMISFMVVIKNIYTKDKIRIYPDKSKIWFENIPLNYDSYYQNYFAKGSEQLVTLSHILNFKLLQNLRQTDPNIKIDLSGVFEINDHELVLDTLFAYKKFP